VVETAGELLEAQTYLPAGRQEYEGNQQPSPEVLGKVQRLCTCCLKAYAQGKEIVHFRK